VTTNKLDSPGNYNTNQEQIENLCEGSTNDWSKEQDKESIGTNIPIICI